jgi:hypothetical protein
MSTDRPFERTAFSNKPGIVGARWWQESMSIAHDPIARRQALSQLMLVGAAVTTLGVVGSVVCAAGAASGGDSDHRVEPRDSLAAQREFGWDFAARGQALTFDGQVLAAYSPPALDTMASDLVPAQALLRPYYVPSLFQSPPATPRTVVQDDTIPFIPLKLTLRPIFTAPMDAAYRRGKALASLFAGMGADEAVIVDLSGPESVAFAAGAAERFDPVFAFDNWPHPRGVVPAHKTLAAAAYYQPLFIKQRSARRGASPPMFVLDRARLSPYSDETQQFDNRHVARLPSSANLRSIGVKRVLYVTPDASTTRESDDINADMVSYAAAGLDVKMIAATDFNPDPGQRSAAIPAGTTPDEWPPYYYGGSADTHYWFFRNYPWGNPPRPPKSQPSRVSTGYAFSPSARSTPFSGSGMVRPKPPSFGAVPVVVAIATGIVVGAAYSRSGSLGRSYGWGGG